MKKYNYIYKITNLINGKIYIGKHSTNTINDGYMGSGSLIKKAIEKYGVENFTKEYLAFCDTEDKLNWLERFYIKKLHSRIFDGNYNLTDGGEGVTGYKHSEEIKRKIKENSAKTNLGKHLSETTKNKISESKKGQFHYNSEETRKKISEANKGKHISEEAKKKISDTLKGHIPSNKGKQMTEEQKIKISKTKSIKYKWLTPNGEIKEMDLSNAHRYHKDWIKIEE